MSFTRSPSIKPSCAFIDQGYPSCMTRTNPMITAVRKNNHSRLARLLELPHRHPSDPDPALALAAEIGRSQLVRLLAPHCSKEVCGRAMAWAASHNQIECVRALLHRTSGPARGNAVSAAVLANAVGCLDVLIPACARLHCSRALTEAAEYGHGECVRRLLPHANPRHKGSMALYWAALYKHAQVLRLLIPLSDTRKAAQRLILVQATGLDMMCHHLDEGVMRLALTRMPGQLPGIQSRLQEMEMERTTPLAISSGNRSGRL